MEIGKVPENILKRSVFRQIKKHRKELLLSPGVGEDCAAIQIPEGQVLVMSTDPITATKKGMGTLAVHVTANDLATSGASPIGVLLSILLPKESTEEELRCLMQEISFTCDRLQIEIMGGHTEVTDVVKQPVVTVTGVGTVPGDQLISTGGMNPGDELVMTKWAGLEGTAILASEYEHRLQTKFPDYFISKCQHMIEQISILPEAKIARDMGATMMHDVTEGGIFGALWEVGAASGTGIFADLKNIPVLQETIEVCEFFSINPYELISSGSLLIAIPHGNQLVDQLKENGIFAAVIGRATDDNDRVVRYDGKLRHLEPASPDQIYFAKEE